MDSNDLSSFKGLYLKTARDYIVSMKDNVDRLKANHQDQQAITDMHIIAHSLKSQSLVMGYSKMGKGSEQIEKIFSAIKNGGKVVTPILLDQISSVIEKFIESLSHIETTDTEIDTSKNITELEQFLT